MLKQVKKNVLFYFNYWMMKMNQAYLFAGGISLQHKQETNIYAFVLKYVGYTAVKTSMVHGDHK